METTIEQTLTVRLADGSSFTVASSKADIAALCVLLRQARQDGGGVQAGTVVNGTVAMLTYVGDDETPMNIVIPVLS